MKRAQKQSDNEFDSALLSLEMAAIGHGVALARTSFAEDFIASGRLVEPFSLRTKATDNVYLVHETGLSSKSPAAIFRDWLLKDARQVRKPKRKR